MLDVAGRITWSTHEMIRPSYVCCVDACSEKTNAAPCPTFDLMLLRVRSLPVWHVRHSSQAEAHSSTVLRTLTLRDEQGKVVRFTGWSSPLFVLFCQVLHQ